jgi:hypothetical protein
MSGQTACQHEKVYDHSRLLTSHPAQRPWVCRKCKVRGSDPVPEDLAVVREQEEYDRLTGRRR